MHVLCGACGLRFDDEFRSYVCPHDTFPANDGANNHAHHPESYLERRPMHPGTEAILKFFVYEHLPPHLQAVSKPLAEIAQAMAQTLDGPELTAGLRKLLEAKDCFVRAALK